MKIHSNVSLKSYNTFGVDAYTKNFAIVKSVDDLAELFNGKLVFSEFFVLGGGSNILFTKDFNGLVIKNEIKGISVAGETENEIQVKSGAGEIWHDLVLWAIKNNYGGIENLSLIPGCVGAGPIQNIGAYGVEIKDVFHSLDAFDIESGDIKTYYSKDCEFGYRNSVFKNKFKNKVIIISVTLQLAKKPELNIKYGSLKEYIALNSIENLNIKSVSDAVCNIRRSKLPNPTEIGNAGSFFKNPIISILQFNNLKEKFSGIVGYPVSKDEVKVAAGWLIESCGWKGKRIGDTGAHAKQSLVLVNYGKASGKAIYDLSEEIIRSVKGKYEIVLEREVNIL